MLYRIVPLLAATAVAAQAASKYDYIVVGSGPGGGPLASELARAGYSTLLIDAGQDEGENPIYSELGNFLTAGNDPTTRWDFWVKHSDDDEQEKAYKYYTWRQADGEFYVGTNPPAGAVPLGKMYPRAGTLGGCAMHNGGVVSLPQDSDFERIVKDTGDKTWAADNMRKYLVKIEANQFVPRGTPGHGFDGWLPVNADNNTPWASRNVSQTRIARALAQQLGLNTTSMPALVNGDLLEDVPNRDQKNGIYSLASHADRVGHRSSPNPYIRATVAGGFPLTLKLNTLVTKVLFANNTKTPTAVGVEVMEGKSLYSADPRYVKGTKGTVAQLFANKEVIISGGTFNTPQILKLSGIGPERELKRHGIKVVKDAPGVGENLGDNKEAGLLAMGQEPTDGGLFVSIFRTMNAVTKNRNIWTWCGGFSFEGFWPGFPFDYGPKVYECAMVHISASEQKGKVLLRSADPQDVPDINFHFHEGRKAKQDLAELVEGANVLRKAWQSAEPKVLPYDEIHPCPGTGKGNCTQSAMETHVKEQMYSHHATSTAAIGGDRDRMAVLDSKFRVRGVKNLRVVDASVWPVVPGAFPVVPTMMISVKAADDIIAERKAGTAAGALAEE